MPKSSGTAKHRVRLLVERFYGGSVLAASEAWEVPQRTLSRVVDLEAKNEPSTTVLAKIADVHGHHAWLLSGTGGDDAAPVPPELPGTAWSVPWGDLLRLRRLLDVCVNLPVDVREMLFNFPLQVYSLAERYLPRLYLDDELLRPIDGIPREVVASVYVAARRAVQSLRTLLGAVLTFPPGSSGRGHSATLASDGAWLAKNFPLTSTTRAASGEATIERIASAIRHISRTTNADGSTTYHSSNTQAAVVSGSGDATVLPSPRSKAGMGGLELRVMRDGQVLGRLRLFKGTIEWVPRDGQTGHKMDWKEFAQLMEEGGEPEPSGSQR